MIETLLFVLGAVCGSFAGTAIRRLPQNRSLIRPRSFCDHCRHRLEPIDLVPVFSWLFLRGRCRHCHRPFTAWYGWGELAGGILMVLLYGHFGLQGLLVKAAVLLYFLAVVSVIDFSHRLILHRTMIYMAGCGIVGSGLEAWGHGAAIFIESVWACLTAGGIMAIIFWLSRGGMGWGDVILAAVLGLWMNVELVLLTIFFAFLLGGVWGVILVGSGYAGRQAQLPFAPFLSGAAALSLLYGQEIIAYYVAALF